MFPGEQGFRKRMEYPRVWIDFAVADDRAQWTQRTQRTRTHETRTHWTHGIESMPCKT